MYYPLILPLVVAKRVGDVFALNLVSDNELDARSEQLPHGVLHVAVRHQVEVMAHNVRCDILVAGISRNIDHAAIDQLNIAAQGAI